MTFDSKVIKSKVQRSSQGHQIISSEADVILTKFHRVPPIDFEVFWDSKTFLLTADKKKNMKFHFGFTEKLKSRT